VTRQSAPLSQENESVRVKVGVGRARERSERLGKAGGASVEDPLCYYGR
jgi:hypothetical protein